MSLIGSIKLFITKTIASTNADSFIRFKMFQYFGSEIPNYVSI